MAGGRGAGFETKSQQEGGKGTWKDLDRRAKKSEKGEDYQKDKDKRGAEEGKKNPQRRGSKAKDPDARLVFKVPFFIINN